jgi:hypothetical protein
MPVQNPAPAPRRISTRCVWIVRRVVNRGDELGHQFDRERVSPLRAIQREGGDLWLFFDDDDRHEVR